MEQLLNDMSLPSLSDLRKHRNTLFNKLLVRLDRFSLGKGIKILLEWMNNYATKLNWMDRLANPLKNLNGEIPVPIIFSDNQHWEGSVLPMQGVEALSHLVNRQNEMLRYPISRNLVD